MLWKTLCDTLICFYVLPCVPQELGSVSFIPRRKCLGFLLGRSAFRFQLLIDSWTMCHPNGFKHNALVSPLSVTGHHMRGLTFTTSPLLLIDFSFFLNSVPFSSAHWPNPTRPWTNPWFSGWLMVGWSSPRSFASHYTSCQCIDDNHF